MAPGVRLGLKIGAGLLVLVLSYVGITFVQVVYASRQDKARPADAIVVFGAAQYNGRPSAVLRARLDHAVRLWRRDVAPVIVVTGGRRPGDRVTEATASASYLHGKGVPDSAILREVSGRSSWQSLASAAAFLKARGVRTVVLVSDRFHAARIAAMADELGLDGYPSPARDSPIAGAKQLPYLAKETVAVAVGRIFGYRRMAGISSRTSRN